MNLDDAFWPALWSLAIATGTRPEVYLVVWYSESGLDPAAQNPIGCIGLNQSCPSPNGPGFPGGDADAYRSSPASAQLAWIAPQVTAAIAANGGPFRSAARYLQANWLPATLPRVRAPREVVAAVGGPYAAAYAANTIFDVTGDGATTLEDLGHYLLGRFGAAADLKSAIAQAYATRPASSPWAAPSIVWFEPGAPSSPAPAPSGRGGLVALVLFGAGLWWLMRRA